MKPITITEGTAQKPMSTRTFKKLYDGGRRDFSGVVFERGADLGGVDLGGANLRGADLREADLRGADLIGAKNLELTYGLGFAAFGHTKVTNEQKKIIMKALKRAVPLLFVAPEESLRR
jgi:hypothetical protein